MPLPRYQSVRKRIKVAGPSLDDLNDYCLSKIISYALGTSKLRESEPFVGDNGRTEKNLSMVSKRWYFLTQTQVGTHGVHRIDVKPNQKTSSLRSNYDIKLFRQLQPKLLKYKHIQIKGSLTVDDFIKLVVTLDSTRVERLDLLRVRIENAKSCTKAQLSLIPNRLLYLKVLTLTWSNDSRDDDSNALLWTVFERTHCLKELHLFISDDKLDALVSMTNDANRARGLYQQTPKILIQSNSPQHPYLDKVIFNKSKSERITTRYDYSVLIQEILTIEKTVSTVETNDGMLIEHLIKSSDRICTKLNLKSLTFTSPELCLNSLEKLIRLQNLGTNVLSIVVDGFDLVADIKLALEDFKLNRPKGASCKLNLHLKDQKYSDCEDKVKSLAHLSRLADVTVHISALQRISIDCCHLMWSTGRAIQSNSMDSSGKCIFKITLQTYPIKQNTVNPCEITIPLGTCSQYRINSTKEDVARHREIMRSLKRECYHQFVKSVRDNVSP